MRLKFRLSFLLLVLLSALPSCVELEEDTRSILSLGDLSGEADIQAALAPVYRSYQSVLVRPHIQQTVTYGSDDITTWQAGNKEPLRVFDQFNYGDGRNADINFLPVSWDAYWQTIYYANTLIAGLQTATAAPEIIAVADGEARFLRALSYFNLVRSFGNMPLILENDTPTGEEQRATVLVNYLAIENDLLIAEANLPEPGATRSAGHASRAAAKALLADLYLSWAGWPLQEEERYAQAAAKAKEVIDLGYFELLPIDQLWAQESQNSRESIFAMQFSEAENIRSLVPMSYSFHEARGFSDLFPERQFFRDFPEGPRKDVTFATEIPQRQVVGGELVSRDPPTKPWQESQRNHPMYGKFTQSENLEVFNRPIGFRAWEVIRYAEVLLIHAEASARASGGTVSGEGLEHLNQIRRRAMGLDYRVPTDSVDLVTATADEVVAEKGWELAGEFKRWWDLVRLEKVAEANADRDPTEEVPLVIPVSEIGEQHYIAPIPFKAISTSNLVQNPEGFVVR